MGNYLDGYAKEICGHCGLKRTSEGHDGCIGELNNVMNACCGHGENKVAYVQFLDGSCIRGDKALKYINENRCAGTDYKLKNGKLPIPHVIKRF